MPLVEADARDLRRAEFGFLAFASGLRTDTALLGEPRPVTLRRRPVCELKLNRSAGAPDLFFFGFGLPGPTD